PPEGDPARGFAKMLGGDLPTNPPFELDNRGKRSVVLDLATEPGRSAALELIDDADVFVTNIRKSALARVGLDPDTLRTRNAHLVYALVTGFGMEGPDADAAAYDIAAWWSRSGIAWLLTSPGSDPPFQRGGMGDHTVGMTAAAMVCAALVARQTTGKGQLVTASLLRQGAYTVGFDVNTYLMWGMQFQGGAGLVEVPDGSSTTTMVNTPVDFCGTPGAPRAIAPELGQHTDEVLAELKRA